MSGVGACEAVTTGVGVGEGAATTELGVAVTIGIGSGAFFASAVGATVGRAGSFAVGGASGGVSAVTMGGGISKGVISGAVGGASSARRVGADQHRQLNTRTEREKPNRISFDRIILLHCAGSRDGRQESFKYNFAYPHPEAIPITNMSSDHAQNPPGEGQIGLPIR